MMLSQDHVSIEIIPSMYCPLPQLSCLIPRFRRENSGEAAETSPETSPPPQQQQARATPNRSSKLQSYILKTPSLLQPFKCDECKKKFRDEASIRRHVQIDHLQLGKKCEKCDFEGLEDELRKHVDNQHDVANQHDGNKDDAYQQQMKKRRQSETSTETDSTVAANG